MTCFPAAGLSTFEQSDHPNCCVLQRQSMKTTPA